MKTLSKLLAAATLAGTANLAMAADAAHGNDLKQENCMSCHGDEVYTRQDRKVTTLAGLGSQVRRCELSLGLQWFDDDVESVVAHLNDAFYKFK
ncbi:MAG: cytochrome c [Gammaproteobacteria bacterium]